MNKFLYHDIEYRNFTLEHAVAILFFSLIIYGLVSYSNKYFNNAQKRKTIVVLSFIPILAMLLRMVIDWNQRGLNLADDLPLHLCRILTIAAPIVVLINNDRALKIFYYMVLAGVVNAMITADIEYGFPYYGYFLYWIYHGFLVVMTIYAILVNKIHLAIKDGFYAFVTVNLYFVILHLINLGLDSNYMYSRHKPAVASVMDLLGEWPVYLLWMELIALLMILIIYLIFGKWITPVKKGVDL